MHTSPSIETARNTVLTAKQSGKTVGLVPTMGALHDGHLSLVAAAREECDFVAATIFVNPTQFNESADFDRYPRNLADDVDVLEQHGVDFVFHPDAADMYPAGASTFVDVDGLSTVLEGKHRPGHFQGVATIVVKLFNILPADIAYFGRKDYQQQLLLRRVVADLNMPIEIRTCPTVREPDGLALSSRNVLLSDSERQTALAISRTLREAKQRFSSGESDKTELQQWMTNTLRSTDGLELEYAVIADGESLEVLPDSASTLVCLVAARVGKTRLIDNLPLTNSDE